MGQIRHPGSPEVANSRYARLVKLLYVVRKDLLGSKFNNILQAVFTCSGKAPCCGLKRTNNTVLETPCSP